MKIPSAVWQSLLVGVVGAALRAQDPLPKPLPIYFLEFSGNLTGDNRIVAADLTTSLEEAFLDRRRSFRIIDKRNVGEIVAEIAKNLQKGERPPAALLKKANSAYGFVRGELLSHDDGVELRLAIVGLDSEVLWRRQRTRRLLDWKDSAIRKTEAEALAADAEARLFPAAQRPAEDAPRGVEAARAGDCPRAVPFLINASAVEIDNVEVLYWLAHCQNLAGDHEAAAASATRGLALQRRADLFLERASSLYARRLLRPSLEDADRALQTDPRNSRAHEIKGDVLMQLMSYGEAINYFSNAYQANPTRSTCAKLAEAYRKNGTPGQALTVEAQCRSLPR